MIQSLTIWMIKNSPPCSRRGSYFRAYLKKTFFRQVLKTLMLLWICLFRHLNLDSGQKHLILLQKPGVSRVAIGTMISF